MNDHARDHDPDQIVTSELMARTRPARPAAAARRGFWPSLTTIEQAAFLASAREVVYPPGAVLWAEGQSADRTIVIKSGSVRVSVERDGHERIIAFRGPGDILGERAALMLRRRSATVVAMDTLHALRLSTQEFVAYLSDHPRVVAVLEQEMYHRMTEHGPAQPAGYATGPMHPYGPAALYGPPQPYASEYAQALPYYRYAMTGPFTVTGAYAVPDARTGGAAYMANAPYMPNGAYTPNGSLPAHTIGAVVETSYEEPTYKQPTYDLPTQPMEFPRHGGAPWAGQNCTIVYTDVAGFSSPGRDDADRLSVRRTMYRALREAFEDADIPWEGCHVEDRGDGALIVVPPQIRTAAVIDPMLVSLGMRLRRHNLRSSEAVRVQLRVAVNVGPVMPDPPGVSGSSIITTARLLDAEPLKQRLAATGADLGVIASRFVYDAVIVHSPGHVKAAEYEQISCRVKGSSVEGWIHLHGLPAESAI